MFNTGDLASWNHDGSVQMHGREDAQVKIKVRTHQIDALSPAKLQKGFRVELAGVVSVMEVMWK
jgi:hypothetical protein